MNPRDIKHVLIYAHECEVQSGILLSIALQLSIPQIDRDLRRIDLRPQMPNTATNTVVISHWCLRDSCGTDTDNRSSLCRHPAHGGQPTLIIDGHTRAFLDICGPYSANTNYRWLYTGMPGHLWTIWCFGTTVWNYIISTTTTHMHMRTRAHTVLMLSSAITLLYDSTLYR